MIPVVAASSGDGVTPRLCQVRTPVPAQQVISAKELGAVTAEFAVALPAVVLLLSFLLAGGAAGITQLRLEEAVRAGARASARGDSSTAVEGTVRRLAGEGANLAVANDAGWVTVRASARVGGALGPIIPWTLTAAASAKSESGIP
ncbi:TadE family protein [Arthrobacter sp. efr-133-TYG-104]|uniref:TadE family protein n=1 Tax=Arthrobacter sp. efr-133-TYG-104 TaxID=3040324 RepID=UPI00254D55D6|nr:TadE family protein [Arthrobacter sp. efr-133-TYG-104]